MTIASHVARPDVDAITEALALMLAAAEEHAEEEAVTAYCLLSDSVAEIIIEQRARAAWRTLDPFSDDLIEDVALEPFRDGDVLIGWHAVGRDEDERALFVANVVAESLTVDDHGPAAR